MKFEDLKKLYLQREEQYGVDTYKYVSQILKESKVFHKKDWLKNPTPKGDHEQSWRAFKGKSLEKLIQYIITEEVEDLGLKVINGNKLEKTKKLSLELSKIKRKIPSKILPQKRDIKTGRFASNHLANSEAYPIEYIVIGLKE